MLFELEEILRICGATVLRWPQTMGPVRPTSDVEEAGPGSLYFPVRRWGPWPMLLSRLAANGASGVVLWDGQHPSVLDSHPQLGAVRTSSPPSAFFELAQEARSRMASLVIGLTGSSGKTSTKEFLSSALRGRYRVRATVETNNLVTDCAELLMGMDGEPNDAAVIEMGFGWVGDIERMASLAKPHIGLITKITPAHLDGAQNSWHAVAYEKGRLGLHLPSQGYLLMHAEDPGCGLLPRWQYRARVLTFGSGPTADAQYSDVQSGETGTTFSLRLFGNELSLHLRTFGEWQAANAAAVTLTGHVLDIPLAEIRDRLEETPPVPHRFEIHRFRSGLTVIDDTFNATPDAMLQGLAFSARVAGERRKVAFLGGIAKLGEHSHVYNRAVGEQAVKCGFSAVVLIMNPWSGPIREGLAAAGLSEERIREIHSYDEIPAALMKLVGPDTLLYAKALYTNLRMQEFLSLLKEAGWSLETSA